VKLRQAVLIATPLVLASAASVALTMLTPGISVRMTASPLAVVLGIGGALSLTIGVWIGRRSRLRSQREQLQLDGANQARAEHSAFLARLDHEMKNPLTAIRAALAAHGTQGSPHLEVADTQVRRLSSLVSDLRKLSDLQSRPLECEAVDLGETVNEAVAAVQTQLAQLGDPRRFSVQFPTAPWRIPPVTGDSDLLYLAIFNLLSNAAKFTTAADSVEVRAGEADGNVWVEVADTGVGIPESELPQMWDELARATNARGIPGTGLGLPLVKVVVERHGGRVGLRSRQGAGTAVRIELPTAPRPN
jgi:two-component system, OmpR family, sensor kinase